MRPAAFIVLVTSIGSAAIARNPLGDYQHIVTVCSDMPAGLAFSLARSLASGMFTRVGVTLQWHGVKDCPEGALRVTLVFSTPDIRMPGVLGYALPYDGTHVVVFWERVQAGQPADKAGTVLAHVLTHEITHILQGCNHHSASGMMKARWGIGDFNAMQRKGLDFTEDDIDLIHLGMARRENLQLLAR